VDRFDFAADVPAGTPEAAIEVARAAGMDQVVLRSGKDQWWTPDEVELDAESIGGSHDKIQRGIGPATLDGRDVCARDADCVGQGLLRDIGHRAGVETQPREPDSEVRWHAWSEANDAHLARI
jgi:hypothetical protein